MNLGVDVAQRGVWVVIAPLGDLDMASAPALRQEVVAAVAAGSRHVVIDLGSVEFIDSVGLGVLLGARKRLRSNDGELELARLSARVRQVFSLVELDRIFELHRSVEAVTGARE